MIASSAALGALEITFQKSQIALLADGPSKVGDAIILPGLWSPFGPFSRGRNHLSIRREVARHSGPHKLYNCALCY